MQKTKKKNFTNSPLNPFAAAEAAAAEILGITDSSDEQQPQNTGVDNVVNVEQQNQQQENSNIEQKESKADVDNVASIEQTVSKDEGQTAKTPKRTFPGKQHMHLILPNELADAVKLLAKIQNKSVNTFMTDLINTHMEDWQPLMEQLGRLDKNIGVKSSKKKLL